MTHGSLFAGIGGFDLGFERVGLRTIWQVEIDPFCRRVLARHFPDSERFTDIKQCSAANLKAVDVITAGVPCQDVSVAGRRAGLAGERTGLFYEFARILRELRPAWFVFENVPGLFSSNRGRDFAEVLRVLMAECGYGICWRVLDSRFFGVAQRRRRVFIVGRLGGPCPLSVLFEPESSCRHPAPRQEAGPEITGALGGGAYGTGRRSEGDPTLAYVLTANSGGTHIEQNYVASTLGTRMRGQDDGCDNLSESLTCEGVRLMIEAYANATKADSNQILSLLREASESEAGARRRFGELVPFWSKEVLRSDLHGQGTSGPEEGKRGVDDGAPSCTENQGKGAVREVRNNQERRRSSSGRELAEQRLSKSNKALPFMPQSEPRPPKALHDLRETPEGTRLLRKALSTIQEIWRSAQDESKSAHARMLVRRLTASECETLQGFPVGWTIPEEIDHNSEFPFLPEGLDSARCRALGNAVTVNVAEWIARRVTNRVDFREVGPIRLRRDER